MSEKVTAAPKTETPSKPTSWDLRSWLATVEELGELEHVSGAHWDVELGVSPRSTIGSVGPLCFSTTLSTTPQAIES